MASLARASSCGGIVKPRVLAILSQLQTRYGMGDLIAGAAVVEAHLKAVRHCLAVTRRKPSVRLAAGKPQPGGRHLRNHQRRREGKTVADDLSGCTA
jgi:hypothetical protein